MASPSVGRFNRGRKASMGRNLRSATDVPLSLRSAGWPEAVSTLLKRVTEMKIKVMPPSDPPVIVIPREPRPGPMSPLADRKSPRSVASPRQVAGSPFSATPARGGTDAAPSGPRDVVLTRLDPFYSGYDAPYSVLPLERRPDAQQLQDEARLFAPLDADILPDDVEEEDTQGATVDADEKGDGKGAGPDLEADEKHGDQDTGPEAADKQRSDNPQKPSVGSKTKGLSSARDKRRAALTAAWPTALRARIEESGLYAPPESGITRRNLKTIVLRHLREDPQREIFFDRSGIAATNAYPVSDGSQRIVPYTAASLARADARVGLARTAPALLSTREASLGLTLRFDEVLFDDHPQYSEEDVLATRVDKLYVEYTTRVAVDLLEYHARRVRGLTAEAKRVRTEHLAAKRRGDRGKAGYYRRKLMRVLEQGLAERERRDREEFELRMVFRDLYEAWSHLRTVRRTTPVVGQGGGVAPKGVGYVGNRMQLRVKKIQMDRAEEQARFKADLEEELLAREALHRLREASLNAAEDGAAASAKSNRREFPADKVRSRVEARMTKCRKRPGRPLYVPVLRREALDLTPDAQCSEGERARRQRVASCRVRLALRVNGRRVTSTDWVPLEREWPRLRARFDRAVELELRAAPKSVVAVVEIQGGMGGYAVAEARVDPPDSSSREPVHVTCELTNGIEVGRLAADGKDAVPRYVSGRLLAAVRWSRSAGQGGAGTLADPAGAGAGPGVGAKPQPRQRGLGALDPNHPDNAAYLEVKRRADAQHGADTRGFELLEMSEELLLKRTGAPESLRKRVLRARHRGELVTADDSVRGDENGPTVPLRDQDIPEELCAGLEDSGESAQAGRKTSAGVKSKPQQAVREPAPAFLNFNFSSLQALAWIFEPRRLLRPTRLGPLPTANPRRCRLMVQVVRGQNIPVQDLDGDGVVDANAVWVEVSFRGSRRRTALGSGANPTWNELLALPVPPPREGGYTSTNLLSMTDMIRVNLYDRHEDVSRASAGRGTVHSWHDEWLGSLEVPFTTVYLCRPIDAAFSLSVPLQALGYRQLNARRPTRLWLYLTLDPPLALPPGLVPGQVAPDPPRGWFDKPGLSQLCRGWLRRSRSRGARGRHLTVLVPNHSGDPILCTRYVRPLAPPAALREPTAFTRFVASIPFFEDHWKVEEASDFWCTADEFLTLGWGDSEEHALLLCNYFKHRERSAAGAAAGDADEKNFSNSGTWRTFVCSGTSIVGGAVQWVLRVGSEGTAGGSRRRVLAYDPVSGKRYDVARDAAVLPLVSVGSLFDETNVWANVQAEQHPWDIDYDLDDRSSWLPLFSSRMVRAAYEGPALACVQPPVTYYKIPRRYFEERAAEVERIIERHFEKWRSEPTTWDYGVGGALRECLEGLEPAQMRRALSGEGIAAPSAGLRRIKRIYPGIQGFTLRFKDSPEMRTVVDANDNPVIERIRQTRLHDRAVKGHRFALAVHIHPYPNHIGSLWVYIAALPADSRLNGRS